MTPTRAAAAALAAVALLGLSSCATERLPGGAAAVVGDDVVEASEVLEVADGLSGTEGASAEGRTDLQRRALQILVQQELFEDVAAQQGVEVDEGEVEATVGEVLADPDQVAAARAQGIAPELLPIAVRLSLLQEAITETVAGPEAVLPLLQQAADDADVRVDPRLGELDEDLTIQPVVSELSSPVAPAPPG